MASAGSCEASSSLVARSSAAALAAGVLAEALLVAVPCTAAAPTTCGVVVPTSASRATSITWATMQVTLSRPPPRSAIATNASAAPAGSACSARVSLIVASRTTSVRPSEQIR